jgi:selenocysteine lyase/cysteine desulfurase
MPKRREFIKKVILTGLAAEFGTNLSGLSTLLANQGADQDNAYAEDTTSDYWAGIRNQFLVNDELIYLNNSTIGRSPKGVIESIIESTYEFEDVVKTGRHYVEDIRHNISHFFGAKPKEIAFTRNATEGMNIVALGIGLKKDDEIVLTTHEHVGGAMPWISAANKVGAKIISVDLDLSGQLNFERIIAAVSSKTKVVVFSHVTCTNGMVLPAKKIVARCKEMGVISCIDGAQAAGMISLDLNDIDSDYYITCGHKWLFGPKGTGILHIAERNLNILDTDYVGAYSNALYDQKTGLLELKEEASRYEYGTRNTSLLVGLNSAIYFIKGIGIEKLQARGTEMAMLLRSKLNEIEDVEFLTPTPGPYSASILTFKIKDRSYAEVQKLLFRSYRIRVRGIYENELNAIRVSCACYNSEEQIHSLATAISTICSD